MTTAGKFWTLYLLFIVVTCFVALRALAADADVNGFQYHERQVQHPCYQNQVIDCIQVLGDPGSPAYCAWAAQIAVYAAWAREDGKKEIKLYPDHPLTANERLHVNRWLLFGRTSPLHSWEMHDPAYKYCRAGVSER